MIVLEDAKNKKRKLTEIAFSPDGTLVAAGGGDKAPVIWDAATGREAHRLDFYPHQTTQELAFHPSGTSLLVATNGGLIVYTLEGRQKTRLLSLSDYARCFAVDAAGRRIVWHHVHARMMIRDTTTHLTCAEMSEGSEPRQRWQRPPVDPPHEGRVSRLAFFPDGDQFVAAEVPRTRESGDGPRLTIRSTDTGKALHQTEGPGTESAQLAISPRGEYFASRFQTVIHVFYLKDFMATRRIIWNNNRKHFTGIAFHPSGKYLAATSNDETVKLYDTATWEVAKTHAWDIGKLQSVAFSPDGTLAAAGSDSGKIVVWDVDM